MDTTVTREEVVAHCNVAGTREVVEMADFVILRIRIEMIQRSIDGLPMNESTPNRLGGGTPTADTAIPITITRSNLLNRVDVHL
jgi:hypothetical protein